MTAAMPTPARAQMSCPAAAAKAGGGSRRVPSAAPLKRRQVLTIGTGWAAGAAINGRGRQGWARAATPQEEAMAKVKAAQDEQAKRTAAAAQAGADAARKQQASAVKKAEDQQAIDVAKAEADQAKLKAFFMKVLGLGK